MRHLIGFVVYFSEAVVIIFLSVLYIIIILSKVFNFALIFIGNLVPSSTTGEYSLEKPWDFDI